MTNPATPQAREPDMKWVQYLNEALEAAAQAVEKWRRDMRTFDQQAVASMLRSFKHPTIAAASPPAQAQEQK